MSLFKRTNKQKIAKYQKMMWPGYKKMIRLCKKSESLEDTKYALYMLVALIDVAMKHLKINEVEFDNDKLNIRATKN